MKFFSQKSGQITLTEPDLKVQTIRDPFILCQLAGIALLILVLYYTNLLWLFHAWSKDPNFSFGFLIPAIAGFMIYHEYDKIRTIPIDRTRLAPGFGLVAVAMALQLLARLLDIKTIETYSLIVLLIGAVYLILGTSLLRRLAYPILYLSLMVPVNAVLLDPVSSNLKLFASQAATQLIQFFGLPALREGVVIYLPNSTLEVVDACSGLRSLLSLFAIGVFLAYLQEGTAWRRILLVALVVPVSMIANVFRIIILCIISEFLGIEVTTNEVVHNISGAGVFFFGVIFLAFSARLLVKRQKPNSAG